jgi:hypothetical protein
LGNSAFNESCGLITSGANSELVNNNGGTGTNFNTNSTVCTANVQRVREITVGFWQDIYKGELGRARVVQYEYVMLDLFSGLATPTSFAGTNPIPNTGLHPNNNIVFFSTGFDEPRREFCGQIGSCTRPVLSSWITPTTRIFLSAANDFRIGVEPFSFSTLRVTLRRIAFARRLPGAPTSLLRDFPRLFPRRPLAPMVKRTDSPRCGPTPRNDAHRCGATCRAASQELGRISRTVRPASL